jgi:copper transporter 1
MFAGSCIGTILLVMSLEFLRRASREYDRYIYKQAERRQRLFEAAPNGSPAGSNTKLSGAEDVAPVANATRSTLRRFRPSVLQQLIRATFHMLQFAVAYFVMLLAMYYNGYIIIYIIIGAFLGAFVFSWETLSLG